MTDRQKILLIQKEFQKAFLKFEQKEIEKQENVQLSFW